MGNEISKPQFENLTADEIAQLRKEPHSTAIRTAEGPVNARGYSGAIRGVAGSWWLTGPAPVVVGDDGRKTTQHQPDGRAF